jgi:hypothetical protein
MQYMIWRVSNKKSMSTEENLKNIQLIMIWFHTLEIHILNELTAFWYTNLQISAMLKEETKFRFSFHQTTTWNIFRAKHSINISKDEKSTNQNGKLNKKAYECLKQSNRLPPSWCKLHWEMAYTKHTFIKKSPGINMQHQGKLLLS